MHGAWVYFNGHITEATSVSISPFDIGVLRGYAVFDLLRTVGGRPFLLAEHLERLRSSAADLGLRVPESDERITAIIDDLLARNRHAEAVVRLVLTGGNSPDGMSYDASSPTFYIVTQDFVAPPAELYEHGGRLLTERHSREVPSAKSTNYITMLKNRPRIAEADALDLLYHDGTHVFEAASASFYVVRDKKIHAPSDDVLCGTVGSLVLDAARERFEIVRGPITVPEAFGADEAFITSTTRGVMPIVRIDEQVIGSGAVGPVTRELMSLFDVALGRTAGGSGCL